MPTGPKFLSAWAIMIFYFCGFIGGFELGTWLGWTFAFWAKIPLHDTFKVPKLLSDLEWGLVWHPFTCYSQLLDGFLII
jgi:hypothetical protein